MATFGRTDTPAWGGAAKTANNISGSKYTLTENGTITSISLYSRRDGASGTADVEVALYDASGNKLAEGASAQTYSTTLEWKEFTLDTPVEATAGDYFLCVNSDATIATVFVDNNVDNFYHFVSGTETFGTWNASYTFAPNTAGGFDEWEVSIYATYTVPDTGRTTSSGRSASSNRSASSGRVAR